MFWRIMWSVSARTRLSRVTSLASAKAGMQSTSASSVLIIKPPSSIDWFDIGKGPAAVEDLGAGLVQPHNVIPALHDRQAVLPPVVAAAEMNRHRAVPVALAHD